MKLTTINVSIPKPKLKYTVRVNDSLEGIKSYAVDNPFVYVFPLYTCSVDDVPSWGEYVVESWMTRVVQPMWIGNITNSISEVLDSMLDNHLFGGRDSWEMVI